MKLALSEEERLIGDTAERFLREHSDSDAVRAAMESGLGWDRDLWGRICTDMGWHAIPIPEEHGGLGLGYATLALVLEQTGRFLLCSPLFSSVCMAGSTLLMARRVPSPAPVIADTLAVLASGEKTAALGWMDPKGMDHDATQTQLIATQDKTDYLLNGEIGYVLHGNSADILIVAARESTSGDATNIGLFVVPAQSPGVERTPTPTMDQTRPQARIRFKNVRVDKNTMIAGFDTGLSVLRHSLCLAGVAMAAEQVGVAQQCLDMSVRYACERKQFNRPIGSFQAIKHRCADMMLYVESMRSAVWYAAGAADTFINAETAEETFVEASTVAQSYCMEHCFSCAAESIQIHGGVGFSWEYDMHLYFKRAQSSESLLGNSAWHKEQLAQWIFGA